SSTEKGEIVLHIDLASLSETELTVRFSVEDTGIGIPPDKIECLFKSFSQVDSSTTRNYGGTGLGLAISKKLCELMGGQIGVNSEVGKGSEFWFTAVLKKSTNRGSSDLGQGQSIQGKRVLVVDDNATNRKVICAQLNYWGCCCEAAPDGPLALDMLHKAVAAGQPFDLALVDMQMPAMDGAMLGTNIKGDATLQSTRLVMLTSLGWSGDTVRLRQMGFSASLTKPVKQIQLLDAVKSALGENKGNPAEQCTYGQDCPVSAGEEKGAVHILVAEDNHVNQKVIQHILSKHGYQADIVSNGLEAVAALSQRSYPIVFMDIQMPVMDGVQATSQIRDQRSSVLNHDIPVIALTAYAMKGDREKFEAAGMDDYISKPVDPEVLIEKIKKWMRSSDRRQAMPENHELLT
ncbi:MAG: response regulator, partial [Desulfosarcinaceae bacterium]